MEGSSYDPKIWTRITTSSNARCTGRCENCRPSEECRHAQMDRRAGRWLYSDQSCSRKGAGSDLTQEAKNIRLVISLLWWVGGIS